MRIDFIIKNDMLVLERQRDTFSGNVNFYECYFDIQTNRELVWVCVFKKGNEAYQQVIENGICMIPAEVLMGEGELEIGCYASDNAEKFQRISTNWVSLHVSNGAYSEGTAPKIPEKDVWETLVLKGIPYIGENGNWYVFDTEQMGYVDSGRTAKGEKGEKGDRGETGLAGTTNAANALKGDIISRNVTITDISSIEHNLDICIKSKNMVKNVNYPINAVANGSIAGVETTPVKVGKTYTISWDTQNTGAKYWVTLYSKYRKKISGETSGYCDGEKHFLTFKIIDMPTSQGGTALQSVNGDLSGIQPISNFMMEEGETATEYTPYVADVSDVMVEVSDENGRFEEVYSQEDGSVANVISSYPSMAVRSNHPGVVLDVTYNRDINKAFAELTEKFTNAIISLGGNV